MPERLYSTAEAADYLGLKVETVKYHLYQSGRLQADVVLGRTLGFYQSTLDAFKESVPRPGRPPKAKEE
jgi:excisionase family DNA binding protein